MEIKVLTNIDDNFRTQWENFVLEHPNGNFFQAPAAYQFFSGVEGYAPVMIYAEEENNIKGILSAVIIKELGIKGYFSKRCIVYGGPICDNDKLTGLLIDKLNTYLKSKVIYTEFRNLFDFSECKDVFEKKGYECKEHFNFIVEIGSPEDNLKLLDRNRRWQLNKSVKTGAEFLEANTLNEVIEFYSLLKILYKEKVKKPLPDFSFFENFFSIPNLGKYFLVKYNNKIIGGSMCPIYRDTVYEWYKFSLDKEYKHLYPGVLATWAPIEYAAKNGLKYFDFLGAGSADSNYGVREFKSKFGGTEVHFGRYFKINKPYLFWIGKTGLKLLGKFQKHSANFRGYSRLKK